MTAYESALLDHLRQFLTPRRRERLLEVLRQRTRWVTVVLTDIYQQHNASAVLRSCDAFGIQDVHVVEMENRFRANSDISLGSDRWLTLHHYRGERAMQECFAALRSGGYVIAATTAPAGSARPRELPPATETPEDRATDHGEPAIENHPIENHPIESVPIECPVALMFGTEKDGLPDSALAQADLHVHIPMHGFVESFNVSVAAALSLYELTGRLRTSSLEWHLTGEERERLLLDWTRASVPGCEAIERRFQRQWTVGGERGT
jgi:tRNA (guanosine-2'-O-)-methyltransferase